MPLWQVVVLCSAHLYSSLYVSQCRAFALEGRGIWHALSASVTQQVIGPIRLRGDMRCALDLPSSVEQVSHQLHSPCPECVAQQIHTGALNNVLHQMHTPFMMSIRVTCTTGVVLTVTNHKFPLTLRM